jgi:hypothetical protein
MSKNRSRAGFIPSGMDEKKGAAGINIENLLSTWEKHVSTRRGYGLSPLRAASK